MKRALMLLAAETVGVISVCVGAFMIHVPSGFIVSGLAVVAMVETNA